MGLVQPATGRPEGIDALSTSPKGWISRSWFKRHTGRPRRTWAPSLARRLYPGAVEVLDQPDQPRTLSAAWAADEALTTTRSRGRSPHGRAATHHHTPYPSDLSRRRAPSPRPNRGKA